MKSKRAEEYIGESIYDAAELEDKDGCGMAVVRRSDAYRAVEIAEDDMADNACRLFEQFMSGVFTGDTPKKMAQEFKQKLME